MIYNRIGTLMSVLSFLLFSCGDFDKQEESSLRRIIGQNDLKPIFKSSNIPEISNAIGLMSLGCTVSHIGNGLALSAGHCFTKQRTQDSIENIPCSHSKYNITWGKTADSDYHIESKCEEIILLEHNSQRDYALFRVSPSPMENLKIAKYPGMIGDAISIFSHPRKRPLEWSTWCEIEDNLDSSKDFQFLYSCDTEGGSSGAAVLNENFEIIGVHNFYNSLSNRNGATYFHKTRLASILKELSV